jgi:hypothetical protein
LLWRHGSNRQAERLDWTIPVSPTHCLIEPYDQGIPIKTLAIKLLNSEKFGR